MLGRRDLAMAVEEEHSGVYTDTVVVERFASDGGRQTWTADPFLLPLTFPLAPGWLLGYNTNEQSKAILRHLPTTKTENTEFPSASLWWARLRE